MWAYVEDGCDKRVVGRILRADQWHWNRNNDAAQVAKAGGSTKEGTRKCIERRSGEIKYLTLKLLFDLFCDGTNLGQPFYSILADLHKVRSSRTSFS